MKCSQRQFEDTLAVLLLLLLVVLGIAGASVMSKDLPAPTQCSCSIQLDPLEPSVVNEKQLEAV